MAPVHDPDLLDALEELVEPSSGHAWLTSERWDSPSRVGGAAAWLGITGLLVPSARHGSANLVVFVNNLQPDDVLDIG